MTQPNAWTPAEAHSTAALLHSWPQPLTALADGDIPAVVLRGAYPPDHCLGLMRRFEERGYFDPATVGQTSQLSGGPYLDLGTSLGRLGADPDVFFAHAARTHELFATLFEEFADPVRTMYAALSDLAEGKIVQTAHEPDGRLYGPAIFRMYHAAEGHRPHYDSVAKRSRPGYEYAVANFQRQFAGVLCLQTGDETSADEPFIYRCWGTQPHIEEVLREDRFTEYASEHHIPRVQVRLTPGDLYFFCTENIHEVERLTRQRRRVVLAFFFAMSADKPEIFVWS